MVLLLGSDAELDGVGPDSVCDADGDALARCVRVGVGGGVRVAVCVGVGGGVAVDVAV